MEVNNGTSHVNPMIPAATTPTLHKPNKKHEMGHPKNMKIREVQTHASTATSVGARKRPRRESEKGIGYGTSTGTSTSTSSDGDDQNGEREEVEKKIVALKSIIPNGDSLVAVDKLFEETASYILSLQYQIKALRSLASFIDQGLAKENSKFGG